VAEWLCSGLQLRTRRFDSDPRLHLALSLSFSPPRRQAIRLIVIWLPHGSLARHMMSVRLTPNMRFKPAYFDNTLTLADPFYGPSN